MRRVFRIPFGTNRITRDVDDELAFHFEMRIQRLVDAGWTPDAARREAVRQFGDVASVRTVMMTLDQQREQASRRANMMSDLIQDVVYALRALRRNVGFTAVIVAALAIGIGANTSIFTLVDALLLRTLPVDHPEQLVAIGNTTRVGSRSAGAPRTDMISAPLYRDLRANNDLFTDVLASGRTGRLDVRVDGGPGELEHPRGRFVSGNYFSVLGVKPLFGRTLDASMDLVNGASPVTTISHGYWTRRFHQDPSAIGRQILVDGTKMTIVGVTPEWFTGEIVGQSPDLWLPLSTQPTLQPNQRMLEKRDENWLLLLGRLKPGATLAQAEQRIPKLIERFIVANSTPSVARDFLAGTTAKDYYVSSGAKGFSRVRSSFQAPLLTLMIGVGLLLCIICANVANLLLARAVTRGREMAVRLALGADRARLVRQLLTESVVLALLSAVVGLFVAWWGSRGLLLLSADGSAPPPIQLALDVPVLAFTLVVSVLAVLLFGLAPAMRASRVDLASSMRANSQSVAGSALGGRGQRAPLGKVLIAGQVALSVVLLMGATMLVRSLRNLQSTDVGLDRDHLVIVDLDVGSRGYGAAQLTSLVRDIDARISAIPGVAAATYSYNGIFSGTDNGTSLQVPGFVAKTPDDTTISYDEVGSKYFSTVGAHMVAGRELLPEDEDRLVRTAVVNQTLANFYFPNQNAVGRYLRFEDSVIVEIVGVVADTRDHDVAARPDRRAYFPYIHTAGAVFDVPGSLRFAVRTTGEPSALVQRIRQAVVAADPQLPIDGVSPLSTLMSATMTEDRLVARLASGFGVLALLLAAIGLYGVMTYAITRRTGEIGLRVALGAQRGDVIRMVLVESLRLVAVGVAIGLPLALASARLLRDQLHDVPTTDPFSIAVAVGVLAASAVVAVTLPAVRASRVSPIVALRAE